MISRLKDTLLLVGDAFSDRASLREIFESSYNLLEAENTEQALMLLDQNSGCIAAVLADIPLSPDEEVRALGAACHTGSEDAIPVLIFIPPSGTGELEEYAFALGATDVVIRPYTPSSVQRRVQVIVDLFLHKWHLQKLVEEQSVTIRSTNQVMLDALSAIIEHRSAESGNHVLRIRRFTKILLEDVARNCPEYGLTDSVIDVIAGAAALHDIGKISIPDAILNKPGRLTPEEFEIMKTHSAMGSQMIEQLGGMGDVEYLRYAYNICLYHHERWDGRGYPSGLVGDNIPICAQVVGLADAFDALTSPRVYKPALPYDQAINMILNGECGVFSPKLLECFKNTRSELVALSHRYADGHSPKDDAIATPLPGPSWKTNPLNTTQLSHVKYQALLHYINDTVLELDLDNNLYHVVYNPNPDLDTIVPNATFSEMFSHMCRTSLHPDDVNRMEGMRRFLSDEFFRLNLRRRAFPFRIFSPTLGDYQAYELILLRVNTGNNDQRIVIAIWHRLEEALPEHSDLRQNSLHSSPALYGLVSSALRCHTDKDLTIDAGAKGLYSLTGYSETEIAELFDNKLLNLVYPEDRSAFSESMEVHLKLGGRTETEYRLLRKNADPVWVLDKSRVYIEQDDQEYFYHAIRDNSRGRKIHQHFLTTIKRNQIIIDQSEGIVFDWDLVTDTVDCSSRWEKLFGYTPISRDFTTQLTRASHFHPDDLPLLRKKAADMRSSSQFEDVEVRIANSEGKYIWCRIRASAQSDAEGKITHIIGLISDIDVLKRATMTLKEQAERDALTKLLNKASTQQAVTECLARQDSNSLSAMLILDLDNFKAVNDSYGHLYGDTILAQAGLRLRKIFRAHDIIGRIGGDEFLIFLRDIPDEDMLRSRCELILDTFRPLLQQHASDLNVSLSIGVSLIPAHGISYPELFQRADEALYIAKSRGKNQYRIYNPRDKFASLLDGTRVTTRIDSDEQPGMAENSFARFAFRCLYESDNVEATINELLAYIGEQFNVSRVYIFENNDDNTACSNTFEWCNEGIAPAKDTLQNMSYITDLPGWPELFDERGVFYCSDISELGSHYQLSIVPLGIKSMLQCAILDSGVFRGYVGFNECSSNRLWTQEQISLLQFLAEMLAMFLLKKRTQNKAIEQANNLRSVLDNQDAWIYVIDPDTASLKFLNEKIRHFAPESREGMTCYEALMGRNSRCENCPAINIHEDKNATCIVENPNFGVKVRARASLISWNGQDACLMTCHDVTKERSLY